MPQDSVTAKHEIIPLTLSLIDLVNSIIIFKEQRKFFLKSIMLTYEKKLDF